MLLLLFLLLLLLLSIVVAARVVLTFFLLSDVTGFSSLVARVSLGVYTLLPLPGTSLVNCFFINTHRYCTG